jgi:hypothetical protein
LSKYIWFEIERTGLRGRLLDELQKNQGDIGVTMDWLNVELAKRNKDFDLGLGE